MGGTHPHPHYLWWELRDGLHDVPVVLLGDEVADNGVGTPLPPLGVVTDIHGETFTYGEQDIEVQPASVTLSTGDRYPVDQLVLLRRAEQ